MRNTICTSIRISRELHDQVKANHLNLSGFVEEAIKSYFEHRIEEKDIQHLKNIVSDISIEMGKLNMKKTIYEEKIKELTSMENRERRQKILQDAALNDKWVKARMKLEGRDED